MNPISRGTLYLIPTPLAGDSDLSEISERIRATVRTLDGVIAESKKAALAFLRGMNYPKPLNEVPVRLLNEHTRRSELDGMLEPLRRGERWGIVSDAGCPAVADPGADLVRLAHDGGIHVSALAGPSAILLALMASGLNGQRFEFHGYLSRDPSVRRRELSAMEKDVLRSGRTHIWMETPYRNPALLEDILSNLKPSTDFSIAVDLTSPAESVLTQTVQKWVEGPRPELKNRPAIFLLGARL